MRFIDYLRADPMLSRLNRLADAVPFVIDNVAEYVMGTELTSALTPVQERMNKEGLGHFPCIAPGFDNMFLEYRPPADTRVPFAGVHIIAGQNLDAFISLLRPSKAVEMLESFDPAAYFKYLAFVYYRHGSQSTGPLCFYSLSADGDGKCLSSKCFTMLSPELAELTSRTWFGPLSIALTALSLMSCKNVDRQLSPEPHKSRQARRYEERHPDRAAGSVRYYTLQIEPMKQILAREGGAATNGLQRAMHICRGHFSTYIPERPLFGKYSGRFWLPAHVRGTLSKGLVVKDYEVKTAK